MKKGFTLVELLIVLAVIAALMAVATPIALNAIATARANQVAQNLANLKSAVQTAYAVKGLPADAADSKTYLAGYISTFPDGYEVYIDFGAKNPAAATIVYLLQDPTFTAVQKQNPEVQEKLGSAITVEEYPSGAAEPDDGIKYTIIEVPLMSY